MQLKLRRSQTTTGLRGTPVFHLQAVAAVSREERDLIGKYRLGGTIIYASEKFQENLAIAQSASSVGLFRGLRALAAASLNLRITINDLISGTQVQCKSLEELLGVEEAVTTACQNLKGYLETALTFDGREVLVDI